MEENVEEKRNAARVERKGERKGGRVKGPSVCERRRGSRLGACLYVPFEQEMKERTGEKERERDRRWTQSEQKRGKQRIRETLARKRFRPERGRDRVPGGQDRFELSKIYGRRFDLRARGVTPGSMGQETIRFTQRR